MKKLLLNTVTAVIFAASPACAAGSNFFIKANAGLSKLNKGGLKSGNTPFIGAGVGYSLMDNVRADLVIDHFIDPAFKGQEEKIKLDINTLLLNGYVDLFDISITQLFIGAGVGIARVQTETSSSSTTINTTGITKLTRSTKSTQNNFSYAAYIGVSTEFAPSLHGELVYSWRNFATTNDGNLKLKGHHIAAGIRLNI